MAKARAYCSVDGCENKKTNNGLSFFKLPEEDERRNKWLSIIGRPDLMQRNNLKPGSHIVCSVHFEKNMIFQTPRLHPDAMPTKYLPPTSRRSTTPELGTYTIDESTQTDFLEDTNISEERKMNKQTQTTVSLSEDIPGRRKLSNSLQESELKRRRLEREILKIEKEVLAKNTSFHDRLESD